MPKFQNEAILEGIFDSFCLVCEDHFKGEREVISHIAKPVHKKNLNAAQYGENFKFEKILKVKHGYFCIFCGMLLSTLAKAGLHIKEKQHQRIKATQVIERVGDYVSFNGLLIDYEAWSGLMDSSCAVCNVEVAYQNLHKSQSSHILNLIHNVVEFGDQQQIYRKVDESSFHCITCNEVHSIHTLSYHFEDPEHKKRLNKCRVAYLKHNVKEGNIKFSCNCFKGTRDSQREPLEKFTSSKLNHFSSSSSSESFNSANSEQAISSSDLDFPNGEVVNSSCANDDTVQPTVLDSVNTFEHNEVNINFENETAFCKKCFENIKFDYNAIVSHIKRHDRSPKSRDVAYVPFQCEVNMTSKQENRHTSMFSLEAPHTDFEGETNPVSSNEKVESERNLPPSDSKEDNEDPAEFAIKNHLTYERDNKNVYCSMCKVMLPTSLASMKQHVLGNIHKKLESKRLKHVAPEPERTYRKTPMGDYIDELMTIRSFFGNEKVVNDKYCIDEKSFLMITEVGRRLRCQACEVNLTPDEVEQHTESWGHNQAMIRTPVVTSLDKTEFVREVRPGIFHCGYCNLISAPWANLQNHLKSSEHKTVKCHCDSRLRRHFPDIMKLKMRRRMFGYNF